MDNEKKLELIKKIREVSLKHFDELSRNTNEYFKERMVFFMEQPGRTRKINDWGRDEDTDYHIGVGTNGWIKHTTVIELGAGKTILNDEHTLPMTDKDILDMLNKSRVKDYLSFMNRCYELTKEYSSEFESILY